MKVIIFGGCGFLGSWLVKKLILKGYKVTVFDSKINKMLLMQLLERDISEVNFIEGDITNYNDVLKAVRKIDNVINLVGLMTPDCSSNPILGAKVNILGAINIFEAIKKEGIEFLVYLSSAGIFGPDSKIYPVPETHYGSYKLAVEGIARAYYKESNISSLGIRPFVIYGPGREIGRTAGVSLACIAAKKKHSYEIQFSGSAGFVYVEDVVQLIQMSLEDTLSGANLINVNGITENVKNFVKIIKQVIPLSKISIVGDKLEVDEILGKEPKDIFKSFQYTSLNDGITKTINFY